RRSLQLQQRPRRPPRQQVCHRVCVTPKCPPQMAVPLSSPTIQAKLSWSIFGRRGVDLVVPKLRNSCGCTRNSVLRDWRWLVYRRRIPKPRQKAYERLCETTTLITILG